MQNRIHSLEDRIFIYKSLGVSSRACLKNHSRNLHAPLCGIFCKSVKLAKPLDAKPHVWQFDANAEEWGDTVKAVSLCCFTYGFQCEKCSSQKAIS